ncbi:MAG: PepSY-associated TM helix domain-containing protein [Bacteroidales bacterium]|nr:PepSY-associated TM helix domain-containing protein [Bacteroidales bacterium]
MKWRKLNSVLHRDLGYFFTGVILIYAISGLAINHLRDWNPNYSVETKTIDFSFPKDYKLISEDLIKSELKKSELDVKYKKYYFSHKGQMKIFIKDGTIKVDLETGKGFMEKLTRRQLLVEMNYLHYNPNIWWTVYSDIFAVALIIIAITGLIVLKGKQGFKRYGIWLFLGGFLVPVVILILFYY